MPRRGRKGGCGRGKSKGKSDHPTPEHNDCFWRHRIRPRSSAGKPRPENTESQWYEISDIQSDPSFPHSPPPPPPPPCSQTTCPSFLFFSNEWESPPSKANKQDRHSAKLIGQARHLVQMVGTDTCHVKTNASKSEQVSCHHYKCLAINKNGLQFLTNVWQKQWKYAFLANFRSMFLIPVNNCHCLQTLTNVRQSPCDHCGLAENCICKPICNIFAQVWEQHNSCIKIWCTITSKQYMLYHLMV